MLNFREKITLFRQGKKSAIKHFKAEAVNFTTWKDKNFYQLDTKELKKYYPKVESELYDVLKMTSFIAQDRYSLEELYDYWIKTHSKF